MSEAEHAAREALARLRLLVWPTVERIREIESYGGRVPAMREWFDPDYQATPPSERGTG